MSLVILWEVRWGSSSSGCVPPTEQQLGSHCWSDLFPVHVGVQQGSLCHPFCLLLLWHSQGSEGGSGPGSAGFHLCFSQMILSCLLLWGRTFSTYWGSLQPRVKQLGPESAPLNPTGKGRLAPPPGQGPASASSEGVKVLWDFVQKKGKDED